MPELTEAFENINNNKIPEEYDKEYGVEPIFILESDIFGSHNPKPQKSITRNEIYKAIDEQVSANHLQGIQRVRGLAY
jgi:hypothetical protein